MEEYRTAYVFVRNIFAGTLKETDEGYMFEYDIDYMKTQDASPVSLYTFKSL